jgi:hypothetical protein
MNQACEMPIQNASSAEIQQILARSKRIAILVL